MKNILKISNKLYICKEDYNLVKDKGICVIDCSWAKFTELNINLTNVETRSCNLYIYLSTILSSSKSS